ncbi:MULTISPECIES: ABC transporter permease [unclassified Pseudactinotalea]|uniref:ABC transporter permease n=1 Tax=unclassified Pseudactinotalea TaxID=2649176 RepID=UPI00128C9FA6|nr:MULTISPECIES: ABC transporter permease [unclassified Pseudactinotalea]MPV49210.1 FtsX-like permease family protein [Pseudactinotalea sp. HY160]QGH68117.1 FtsX-like permease family protein [Pseudactinotalea sp. HY158]
MRQGGNTRRPRRIYSAISRLSLRTVTRNPLRTLLATLGVALGVAVLVASVGMAATLNAQVNATFDSLRATRIVVQDNRVIVSDPLFDLHGVDDQLAGVPGVIAGGYLSTDQQSASVPVSSSLFGPREQFTIVFATPGALPASLATLNAGIFYDATSAALSQPIVVLGPVVAERLGITEVTADSGLIVAGQPVAVGGILASTGSEPQLSEAIIVDPRVAAELGLRVPEEYTALVRTEVGSVRAVALSLPLTLRPFDPVSVGISYPPEPRDLRGGIQESLNTLALVAAGLAIFIGGVGIMSVMVSAVAQRTGEIGLQRSIGARPRHIAVQILLEGSLIGLLGAVTGAILGVAVLICICLINGWQAVVPTWAWWAPTCGGFLTGALAGLYPASRAVRLSPAEALRTN